MQQYWEGVGIIYVQIEFADSRIRAADYISDIRSAVKSASVNLQSRHKIIILKPFVTDDKKVVFAVRLPEKLENDFSIGNHFRGISSYLLTQSGNRYQDYLVGKRLLNYYEISILDIYITEEISMIDRLEAVSLFAQLLERSDKESISQIRQIMSILQEGGVR